MPKFLTRCQTAQLKLFHPPAKSPEWQALPPEAGQSHEIFMKFNK